MTAVEAAKNGVRARTTRVNFQPQIKAVTRSITVADRQCMARPNFSFIPSSTRFRSLLNES